MRICLFFYILIGAAISRADTPPLGTVNAKLQDGSGNPITSQVVGGNRSLNTNIVNSISATVSSSPSSPLSDQLIVGGIVIDPRSRNWTLGFSTDSVTSNQGGTWIVQPGNTANTTPWLSTISQGGNSAAVSGSNALKVDASAVTQPVSASSLPLPTGAATSANQVTSQTSLSSIATNTTGASTSANQSTEIASLSTIATNTNFSDSTPSTQNITIQDTASTMTTVANGQSLITGTPTAGSAATFTLASFETIRVTASGTWTGTLASEISPDGNTWVSVGVHQNGTSYTAASFTQNFEGILNVAGALKYRVRSTAAMTGTATIAITASKNSSSVYVANSLTIADPTTPTNKFTVKASSTAVAAADPSAVVALSPNTALPANTNASFSNTTVGTAATAISAPANATGFLLESESGNTANCRWAMGGTASSSAGILIEPGRDTGYIPAGVTLSVYCLSASQLIDVQWVLRQ